MEFIGFETCIKAKENEYHLKTASDIQQNQLNSVMIKNGMVQTVNESIPLDGTVEADIKGETRRVHNERVEIIYLLSEFSQNMPLSVDNAVWRDRLGMGFFNSGMYEEAIGEFQKAVNRDPLYSQALNHLGKSYFNSGDCRRAIEYLELAVKQKPDFADFHLDLAEAYLKVGRCEDSFTSAERALIINSFYGRAYYLRALALLMKAVYLDNTEPEEGLTQRIQNDISSAVSIDSSLKPEEYETAWQRLENGDYKDALAILESNAKMPGSQKFSTAKLKTYIKLAMSLDKLSYDEVFDYIAYLEEKLDKNPQFADLHYELGAAHSILGNIFASRASKYYKRALEVNPNFSKARSSLKITENFDQGTESLLKTILNSRDAGC